MPEKEKVVKTEKQIHDEFVTASQKQDTTKEKKEKAEHVPPFQIASDYLENRNLIVEEGEVNKKKTCYLLKWWKEEFYLYSNGVYKKYSESDLKTDVTMFLSGHDNCFARAGVSEISVMTCIKGICHVDSEINEPFLECYDHIESGKHWLNLLNGLLSLDDLIQTKQLPDELIPHSPRFFSLSQIPVIYDKNKTEMPLFQTNLNRVISDKEVQEELQRAFGYSMVTDCGMHISFFLKGIPRSGKSTIIKILRKLVGVENVSDVQWNEFGKESGFDLESCIGKKINIGSEIEGEDKSDEGKIKRIIRETAIQINCKGRRMKQGVTLYCKLWWDTNHFPYIYDKSGAMQETFTIFEFKKDTYLEPEKRIEDYDKIIFNAESNALLNWALVGIIKTYEKKYWVKSTQSKLKLQSIIHDQLSQVEMYVEEQIEKHEGHFLLDNQLWNAFQAYCGIHCTLKTPSKLYDAMERGGFTHDREVVIIDNKDECKRKWGWKDCVIKGEVPKSNPFKNDRHATK